MRLTAVLLVKKQKTKRMPDVGMVSAVKVGKGKNDTMSFLDFP